MGTQRSSFAKLQRERDKKAKAAAKRDRRLERDTSPEESGEPQDASLLEGEGELDAADLLRAIEFVHGQFDKKQISYEEFEIKRTDLLARLPID